MNKWIPVNPSLNDEGEFITLKNYSKEPIKPNPFAGADSGRSEFGEEFKLSISSSSKIEVAAIGGIDNKYGSTTFIHDSIIYRKSRAPIADGSKLVLGTWWGYGIRLKVVIKNVQFGINVNWGVVSAAAQLGYADAEFELEGIGITDSKIFSLLPEPTDLNLESFDKILKIGNDIRGQYHKADPEGVVYKPLRIEVDENEIVNVDPIEDDRHLFFTYHKISQRVKLKNAKNEALAKNLKPDLVEKFYKEIFGIEDQNDRPSFSHKNDATEWLNQ